MGGKEGRCREDVFLQPTVSERSGAQRSRKMGKTKEGKLKKKGKEILLLVVLCFHNLSIFSCSLMTPFLVDNNRVPLHRTMETRLRNPFEGPDKLW